MLHKSKIIWQKKAAFRPLRRLWDSYLAVTHAFSLFYREQTWHQLLQEALCPLVYTSLLMEITFFFFHFKIKIVQGVPYSGYRIENVQVNQISLYEGEKAGCKELFHHIEFTPIYSYLSPCICRFLSLHYIKECLAF